MNSNKKQQGFAHVVILVLVLVVIGVVAFAGSRIVGSDDDSNKMNNESSEMKKESTQKVAADEKNIELQNLGVDLEQVDITTQAVREFEDKGLKGFYVFGDKLSENRINPNFEFASLKSDAQIIAAIDGVIAFIREQPETGDSEVFLQPTEGSMWTIGYDHLINLSVQKGDSVKAGDVLGEPAVQNNGLTRFEIQINKDANGETTHYCPTTLLSEDVKSNLISQLTSMQEQWESVTGFELYDIAAQSPAGCLSETLTPDQAEGQ